MLIVNLYCLVVMVYDNEVRRLEFYLVIFQTITDLVFAGVLGVVFNVFQYFLIHSQYCYLAHVMNLLYFYDDSDKKIATF